MKKTAIALTLATLSCISAGQAFAADSATMTVGGSVITGSCTPSLSSRTVDFGDIKYADLTPDADTSVTIHPTTTLTVQCTTPMSVGYTVTDNVHASLAPGMKVYNAEGGYTSQPSQQLGVGYANGSPIGAVSWDNMDDGVMLDGSSASLLWSTVGGSVWDETSNIQKVDGSEVVTWSTDGVGPAAFTQAATELTFNLAVRQTDELTLSEDASIAGSATIALVYL